MRRIRSFFSRGGVISCIASLLSIAFGLLIGVLLLYVFNPPFAATGFEKIINTGLSSLYNFSKVLYQAAPLIFTGLSVGFAFKTGLFNIGATGQCTIGAFFALVAAIQFQQPWYMAMLAAMIGGALWGFFPGLFKALFNVNEVITSIMFNWISLFFVNLMLANMPMMLADYWGASNADRTVSLATANPGALIPALGLDKLFRSSYMNISIFIAVLFAVILYVILNNTTFGYELKACGHNKSASIYAGISAKRNIILSMVIAGALSGLGGAIYYLDGPAQYVIKKELLAMGFNGIPVALLGASNPVGIIFSGLFISYIQVGGNALQPEFSSEIINIISAAIIYLSAFALLIKEIIARLIQRHKDNETPVSIPKTDNTALKDKDERVVVSNEDSH